MNKYSLAFISGLLDLLPMVAAALVTGGLVILADRGLHPSGLFWAAISPVIYLTWLLIYLYLVGLSTARMGRRYPKPRFQTHGHPDRNDGRRGPSRRGLATAMLCYHRAHLIETLPFVRALREVWFAQNLLLRAYSPSVHVARSVKVWGFLADPDLTYVGEETVIGTDAVVAAHLESIRPNGTWAYTSAPIRIGSRVNIAGGARILLGCEIGDGAVIESGAVLYPFTKVQAGEVWGGNPARCMRTRKDPVAAADAANGAKALAQEA